MLFDVKLQPAHLFIIAGGILLSSLVYSIVARRRLADVPIVGYRKEEWFPWYRAAWRNTWNIPAAEHELYTQYTSKGQAALLPLLVGNPVILPASDTKFLSDCPDSKANMHVNLEDLFQFKHTIMDQDVLHRPIHQHLITTTLTKEIGNLVPEMYEEAENVLERVWGTSDEWKEINVYETARLIIGAVANRVFFGLPICRDPELVKLGMAYAQDIPMSGFFIRITTPVLRPLVAPLITLKARYHTYKFRNLVKPFVQRRIQEYDARQRDPEAAKRLGPPPNDFLEWSIKQAKDSGDPLFQQWNQLADRLLLLNFVSGHTTTFALTNTIIDLVCHNDPSVIDSIRSEITSVLASHNGEWNKRSLASMHKLDSLLRESMRLNGASPVALGRKVTAKEGLDTPSGTHLPYQSTVLTECYSVIRDPSVYGEDAAEFKAFRYAEGRDDKDVEYVERARKAFPTVSPEFLAFGHGRNACPGRFFASSELKIVVGYIIMNYDFKLESERPDSIFVGLTRIPPVKKNIWMRRRGKSS